MGTGIPNELSREFKTVAGRKKLIELYGDVNDMFTGHNEDGEMVCVSFDKENGIVLHTYQHNGWLRVNTYDKDGCVDSEGFDGRWDK